MRSLWTYDTTIAALVHYIDFVKYFPLTVKTYIIINNYIKYIFNTNLKAAKRKKRPAMNISNIYLIYITKYFS